MCFSIVVVFACVGAVVVVLSGRSSKRLTDSVEVLHVQSPGCSRHQQLITSPLGDASHRFAAAAFNAEISFFC